MTERVLFANLRIGDGSDDDGDGDDDDDDEAMDVHAMWFFRHNQRHRCVRARHVAGNLFGDLGLEGGGQPGHGHGHGRGGRDGRDGRGRDGRETSSSSSALRAGPGVEDDELAGAGASDRFAVTLLTISGESHELRDLQPTECLTSLRRRAGVLLKVPPVLLAICSGSQALKASENGRTLEDLGVGEGAVLTCIRAQGAALGQSRYALTTRRLGSDDDLLAAAHAEYGEDAVIADFATVGRAARGELCSFLDRIGFHGSAFVLDGGRSNFRDGRGGHFFACRHSGNIPPNWLVRPPPISDDDNSTNNLDLCWKLGFRGMMPVLVDLGPA